MRHLKTLGSLILGVWLMVGIAACGGEDVPTVLPTSMAVAAAPTLAVLPTEAPVGMETAVSAPTPTPSPNVNFMGIQLTYPETAFLTAIPQLLPPIPMAPGPGIGIGDPERIRIHFREPVSDFVVPREPQLLIYPIADLTALHPTTAEIITQLQTLLTSRETAVSAPLPMIPPFPAVEMFHSQLTYLEFQNGSGIRFLTQYAQGLMPVTNETLFYTFQGLTTDGNFYVAAFFPVFSPLLPPTNADVDTQLLETADAYTTYLNGIVELLNGLNSSDFQPDIALYDQTLQSLLVAPDASFPSPVKPVGVLYEGVNFAYLNTLSQEVTAEKIPAQFTASDGTITPLQGIPDHIRFTFVLPKQASQPSTLTIQPIRDAAGQYYPSLPPAFRDYLENLTTRFVEQPEAGPNEVKLIYTDFANGTGMRYVTVAPQQATPINNQTLFYVYEGVTLDGGYYIRLQFALSAASLPEGGELSPEAANDYAAYVANTLKPLEELETADFTPDLLLLDQLVQSVFVDTAVLSGTEAPPIECQDDLVFVDDITIPDNTPITAGQTFTKIWRIRNSGTCIWDGSYRWVFVNGEQFQSPEAIPFPTIVNPGQEFDIGLDLIAPTTAGTYQGWWQLQRPDGTPVDTDVYLLITVP